MDKERKEELNQEDRENKSHYSDWFSDNKDSLKEDFIEENESRFNTFCYKRYANRDE